MLGLLSPGSSTWTSVHPGSPLLTPQADEPQSPVVSGGVPRLLLGYCRDGNSSDVMIPDTAEGDIFWRRKQRAGYRPTCRAGVCHRCR